MNTVYDYHTKIIQIGGLLMLSQEFVVQLKRSNISKDAEKTKQRVEELWKASSKEDKKAVEELAKTDRVSIARIYKVGSISAKLAVALGQVLNVDPLYLIGEIDERRECSDELLRKFLNAKGYKDIAKKALKPTRKPRVNTPAKPQDEKPARKPRVSKPAAQPEAVPAVPVAEAPADKAPANDKAPLLKMPEDEMLQLVRTLYVRAKYSNTSKNLLDKVQTLMLNN